MVTSQIMLIDDNQSHLSLLQMELEARGFDVTATPGASEALSQITDTSYDVLVSDVRMPDLNGIELCQQLKESDPDLPVVLLTGAATTEIAIKALRAGAYDFLTKPVDLEALTRILERACVRRGLSRELRRLRRLLRSQPGFAGFVGASQVMQEFYERLHRAASSDASVLLLGETGTGKELAARAIHRRSRRKDGPFVAINCAALPEGLLEAELFGQTQGAFTGAAHDRPGLFVEASGGTLLLDEIGDLPLNLQPKLLRALQQKRIRPLGGSERSVDVRILASTNVDLTDLVKAGRFREDLYYRIHVIPLHLPPLRHREEDVLLLAHHFLDEESTREESSVTGLSKGFAERLQSYSWPGNVRELRHTIQQAVAMTRHEKLQMEDLPERIRQAHPGPSTAHSFIVEELVSLRELEERYLQTVLTLTGGNRTEASRILGCNRSTLYRKLKRYDLE